MSTRADNKLLGNSNTRGYRAYVGLAVANVLVSAALLLLLANSLPVDQYANFGVISSVAGLVLLLVNTGHKEALFKFASQSNLDKLKETAQSLRGWLVPFLALALLFLAVSPTAGLAALMFLALYVAIAITAVFRGRVEYVKDAALWPAYRTFWFGGCAGFFLLESELSLLKVFGVGIVAAVLAFLVLGGLQVARELLGSVSLKLSWPLRNPTLRQFFYIEVATVAYLKVDVLLLAVLGVPSKQLATYFFSIQLFEAALLLVMPLGYLFFNQINSHERKEGIFHTLIKFAAGTLAISVTLIVGWVALGEILLGSLFPNYLASNAITGILLTALVPWGLASLGSYSLIAANKEGLVARVFLVGLMFHIVFNVILISLKGAEGAAWARVATEVLIASLLYLFASRNGDGSKTTAKRPLIDSKH